MSPNLEPASPKFKPKEQKQGLLNKTALFIRRLSVFYVLIGVFSVFFGIFYLRFMPANQAELNSRGFRILNQLARNLRSRNQTLQESFSNLDRWEEADNNKKVTAMYALRARQGIRVREQIREHVKFEIDSSSENWAGDYPETQRPVAILYLPQYGWSMVYRLNGLGRAIIKMGDFTDPVFGAREDLFQSYVLLERPRDSSKKMNVLYLQKGFSPSDRISADSALSLEKNTDLEAVSDILIGGREFEVFTQSFELAGKKLVIAGLVKRTDYESEVKSLSTNFVVAMVLTIFLGLGVLPFLKIFFISPGETMKKGDVIKIAFAIYLGTAVLILAGWYFVGTISAQNLVESRLVRISDSLEADIQRDFNDAERQLDWYADRYDGLDDISRGVLAYESGDTANMRKLDEILSPGYYPLVVRLMWFDSGGNTLAKWNPFSFTSPPSSQKELSYFHDLLAKEEGDTEMVLSAAQSNITSEFQFLAGRRVKTAIHPIIGHGEGVAGPPDSTVSSMGLLMAFYLHCGLRPVLPRGFSFCLVDNRSMGVLLHSDSRRNLSENLYDETGSNAKLKNCIDARVKATIQNVVLYGNSHTLYVRPVDGHNITLVVFYDDDTHSDNIFRMLHFGAESLLYIAIAFVLCLWLSSVKAGRPSKLTFALESIEWIRPIRRNLASYRFNCWYYVGLIVFGFGCLAGAWLGLWDIRVGYYVGVLLPFFALWGHVAARKRVKLLFQNDPSVFDDLQGTALTRPVTRGYNSVLGFLFTRGWVVVIALLFLNVYFFTLDTPEMQEGSSVAIPIAIFDVLSVGLMAVCFRKAFRPEEQGCGDDYSPFYMPYIYSVYLSVFVISILPAVGILSYAWSVEKLQYARSDEMYVALNNKIHMDYVSKTVLGQTKQEVIHVTYPGSRDGPALVQATGQYLSPERIQYSPYQDWIDSMRQRRRDYDEPYVTMLDDLFLITAGEYQAYSVRPAAADSSWSFAIRNNGHIELGQVVRDDSVRFLSGTRKRMRGTTDTLRQDFKVDMPLGASLFNFAGYRFFHYLVIFFICAAYVIFLRRLLALTVMRIFLLEYFDFDGLTVQSIIPQFIQGGAPADYYGSIGNTYAPLATQEDFILRTMVGNDESYHKLWASLSKRQQFILYDFAEDGYTNYKEAKDIMKLCLNGVLRYEPGCGQLQMFSISFREFVLRKKNSPEIAALKQRYAVPGLWATIRIPALIIIAACAILLIMTQDTVTHRVTVAITSLGAIVPVVLEMTRKITGK